MRVMVILVCALLLAVPAWAADPPTVPCQTQLAEATISYQEVAKDRQQKELQRDHHLLRVYQLERELQQVQKQLSDLQTAGKKDVPDTKK